MLMAAGPGGVAMAQPFGDGQYGPPPSAYDEQRHDYDAQYGPGSFDRYQADQQMRANQDAQFQQAQYDQQRRDYDAQYGPGAYDRYQADQQARADYQACHRQKQDNEVGGALLGGLAGAVIGSNVTRGGGREGGAIIGGVAGAAAGSQIAKGQTNCDNR
jgi:hypothetical protein